MDESDSACFVLIVILSFVADIFLDMDVSEAKRKKKFSKSEVLLKLEQHENDVRKVAEEVVSELTPFDVTDDNVLMLEDRLERVEKVTMSFMKKFTN